MNQWLPLILSGGLLGGFAALLAPILLKNKNRADAAAAIADGSKTVVGLLQDQVNRAGDRADMAELRAANAEADAAENHKLALRQQVWIERKKAADIRHEEWDDEVWQALKQAGIHVRKAPPLAVESPTPIVLRDDRT